jgi:hypothetical protein
MKPQSRFTLLPSAARWAIVLFGAVGFMAALYAVTQQPDVSPIRLVLLILLAAATARAKVTLYRGTSLSFLTSVVLLAVITQGPAAAVIVAVFGVTVQSYLPKKKLVLHQVVFNASMISSTVMLTWLMHRAVAGFLPAAQMSAETTATLLASFTYFLGNSVSVSLIVALTKGLSMFQVWVQHFMYSAPSFMIAGILTLAITAFASSASLLLLTGVVLVAALPYYCSVRLSAQTAN